MSDYIRRDKAIEICDWWQHEYDESASRIDDIISWISGDIKGLPAADVRENVRGKWIDMNTITENYYPRYKCSVCDGYANYSDYCPYCGAYMRGKE